MALTRKLLKDMGLTDAQIEDVIAAHAETVEALKGEIEALKGAQAASDAQSVDWRAAHDKVQAEYDAYRAEVAGKEQAARVKAAYRKLLVDAKLDPDVIDVVLKATDLWDMQLDENGRLVDEDRLMEAIRTEWARFIVTEGRRGAQVWNPPAASGIVRSRDEIMTIRDTAERQKAIAENHELFGF